VRHRRGLVARFIGQQREVVVGLGAARIDVQGADQKRARLVAVAVVLLREGKIHQRLHVSWIDGKRGPELRGARVVFPLAEIRHAEIVVRLDVPLVDGDGAHEFLHGLVIQPLAPVEEAEIVVRLCVQLVGLQHGAVLQERIFEIAAPLVVERELKVIRL
jgi:hypothetical protein